MKNYLYKILAIICLSGFQLGSLLAQDGSALPTEKEKEEKKIRFNGLGRSILSQNTITGNVLDSDTNTIRRITDGEFLLDVAVNATPNKKTEVQSILRLRNEFGGFFGAGVTVEVRELWARGIIADRFRYRVGDMDVAMTPYTFFNPDEEGTVNEPAAFIPFKDVINYEQFYTDNNTRRVQGAQLDFGLNFTKILDEMQFKSFIARVRATDFFTVPTRFTSGAQLKFSTEKISDSLGTMGIFGFNIAHTFDDLQSGNATSGIRNTVLTADFDVRIFNTKKMSLALVGETGQSLLTTNRDSLTLTEEDDTFLDIGLNFKLKPQKLEFLASFIDVGPDFFSIGAQSKRVDFNAQKSYYNRIGVDDILRTPSIFDLSRDRSLYTFRLSDQLMPYDPRFSNAMPYGTATPNRRGLNLRVNYGNSDDIIEAELRAAFLNEIRGQGTFELKNFTLIRASANFNIHKLIDWENKLRLTAGLQYEQTNRGGIDVQVIDLTSNLFEAGLEIELFKDFEILFGTKILTANGNEYIPVYEEFNNVGDFPAPYIVDDIETLIAGGLRYNFKKGIYLTIQYQTFDSQRGQNNPINYGFNQFFAIYNMNF